MNDITKILEVSSGKKTSKSLPANIAELELLEKFDSENQIDDVISENFQIMSTNPNNLQDNSTAYMAGSVEGFANDEAERKVEMLGMYECFC